MSRPSSMPTFNELRVLRIFHPRKSLTDLFRESYRQRMLHLGQFKRKDFNFVIQFQAHQARQNLTRKNIQNLVNKRIQLQYHCKRARPISLSKQLNIQTEDKKMSQGALLRKEILDIRKHKRTKLQKYRTLLIKALQRPFSTLLSVFDKAFHHIYVNQVRNSTILARAKITNKVASLAKTYFVTTRGLFYWQMLWLRSKLQFYRIMQLKLMKVFTRQVRNNMGLSCLIATYCFYYGWFRKNYVITKKEGEKFPKTWIERGYMKVDASFRELLKFLMWKQLFSNPEMDDITGKALYDLTQMPSIQKIILGVFMLLWDNDSFNRDAYSLTLKIINDYLATDHCLHGFSDIVNKQALRDQQVVLPGLQLQLMNYLKVDFLNVSRLAEQLLINIGWNPHVKGAMYSQMTSTLHGGLAHPTIYDLAVNNAQRAFEKD